MDRLDLMAQVTFVHEYVHALQDQYFDLTRFTGDAEANGETEENGAPEKTDDAILAVRAMVEGDAQFATSLYIVDYVDLIALYKLGQEEADTVSDASDGDTESAAEADVADEADAESDLDMETEVGMESEVNTALLDDAPNFVRESMIFPYMAGQTFILAIYDESGWEGVNGVWDNPPVSTEQILHPARYPDDVPTPVALPADLAEWLGMATQRPWEEYVRNTWGEFQLRTMLAEQVSQGMAVDGADGWDGDQFVFLSDGEAELVVISSVWDSASEARQARTTWRAWLEESGYEAGALRRFTLPGDADTNGPARHVFLTSDETTVHFLLATDETALEAAVKVLDWE
jgi:hypothetical protein